MTWRQGKSCGSCQFFDRTRAFKNGTGACRKHPPTDYKIKLTGGTSDWPQVNANDWCGEWQGDM